MTSTLTPRECIRRARRAIQTRQPRLAQHYMRRASELIEEAARV